MMHAPGRPASSSYLSETLLLRRTLRCPRGCVPEWEAPFPGLGLRCVPCGRCQGRSPKVTLYPLVLSDSTAAAPAEPELGIVSIGREGKCLGTEGLGPAGGVNLWYVG